MYIKSIVLDGFKSYSERTEISGFDNQFNAITGLNGSGKSNILDSICFVLGISNLSQVRASNLQELVYKNGQAGIRKATVSITFDNTDRSCSPAGYEDYGEIVITRQIAIGGKNKYLINGVTATNRRIHDMFMSVHLNINNPHFLIMQGRITKVLNMKPMEILSLLEEAAGTKLYEIKKEETLKTIEKKDIKLRDIDSIHAEIAPQIVKLKQERDKYFKFENICRELEYVTRIVNGCDYKNLLKIVSDNDDINDELNRKMKESEENIHTFKKEENELAEKIKTLKEEIFNLENTVISEMDVITSEARKANVIAKTQANRALSEMKEHEENIKILKKQCEQAKSSLDKKIEKAESAKSGEYKELKEKIQDAQRELKEAEENLKAVSAGLLRTEEGVTSTLAEQVRLAVNAKINAETKIKQNSMKLQHLQKEVVKKRDECKKAGVFDDKDTNSDDLKLQDLKKKVSFIKDEIKSFRDKIIELTGSEDDINSQGSKLMQQMNEMNRSREDLNREMPMLHFQYRDPVQNFDRSKVYGVVAKLISPKDSKFAKALEITAGGRLYNIIVDNDETANLILKRGELQRRVTILPLNRIQGSRIHPKVIKTAQNLVGTNNVFSAIDLLDFNSNLTPAIEYIFGNTLVCPDLDTAMKVAFAPGVEKRTVTFDGDVFDPMGTLSGGSSNSRGKPILLKIHELQQIDKKYYDIKNRLSELRQKSEEIRIIENRIRELDSKRSVIQDEIDQLEYKMRQTDKFRMRNDLELMEEEIQQLQEASIKLKSEYDKAVEKSISMEKRLANMHEDAEREKAAATKRLEKARQILGGLQEKIDEKEQMAQVLNLEKEQLEQEYDQYQKVVSEAEASLSTFQAEIDRSKGEAEKCQAKLDEVEGKLNDAMNKVKLSKRTIIDHEGQMEKCKELAAFNEREVAKFKDEINIQKNSAKDARSKIKWMREKNPWLQEDEHNLYVKDGIYDIDNEILNEKRRKQQELTADKEKLAPMVNQQALNSLNAAENQFAMTTKRRQMVIEDKKKLYEVIKNCDNQRIKTLEIAHKKVNQEFDKIFGTILKNSRAQLVPPAGKTIFEGLEFKIGLGQVWKESLNELSGGQRSLVALSLILSLLAYQPAPLYILDEVDAALDLSHTQNIGTIIKNHFKNSQFIVVSLKDGMFNNANVLFKTKFENGVSSVQRLANKKH